MERAFGGSPLYPLEIVEGLKSVFKDSDTLDDRDFPIFHQIVLGLVAGKLKDELQSLQPISMLRTVLATQY